MKLINLGLFKYYLQIDTVQRNGQFLGIPAQILTIFSTTAAQL